MSTSPHPRPYKLQWLNDNGELLVDKQVVVDLEIGKYHDSILCDVVPMEATHVLLGRPWQYDRSAIHDGHTNKYVFEFKGQKFTLIPLSPKEVGQDQQLMKIKRESEQLALKNSNKGLINHFSKDDGGKSSKTSSKGSKGHHGRGHISRDESVSSHSNLLWLNIN